MSQEINKIEATVADIEALRATVKERHAENVSLVIRFDSVFKSLIDSLSVMTGSKISNNPILGFEPKPLQFVAGKHVGKGEVSEKVIEDQELKMFKQNVDAAYEGFLGRDNNDLLKSLDEETLRGVAKQSGLKDFKTAKVDTNYVTEIKEAIKAKNRNDLAQKATMEEIESDNSTKETHKPTIAELKEIKEKATAEYTELFGEAPDSKLSGAKIQELIDQKKADAEKK